LDEQEAFDRYEDAINAWNAGESSEFIDAAGDFNAWMMEQGYEPLSVDDWTSDPGWDYDIADLSEFIDSLSHEDREAFFGY
jgi:hypothetical protein